MLSRSVSALHATHFPNWMSPLIINNFRDTSSDSLIICSARVEEQIVRQTTTFLFAYHFMFYIHMAVKGDSRAAVNV